MAIESVSLFAINTELALQLLYNPFVHEIRRDVRELKHPVYGKREIQVDKFSKWEMSRWKQLKTIVMDKSGVNLPIFV